MPTKNPRINMTVEKPLILLLTRLADQDDTSVANIAKELMLEALERREDIALSDLATLRDSKKAKRIKHTDAWK